jgi:hypothetical protein
MHLAFFQSQVQLCRICGESIEDHTEECPYGRLQKIMVARDNTEIQCCKCPGRVEVNINDYYECRRCNTRYSRSGFHESLGWERVSLIDLAKDEVIQALVMDEKGQGQFKHDKIVSRIEKEIEEYGKP